ncbi:hypothetical protein HPB50_001692 [Hyalomma asiaticum]|uniref:Uncharacterized protein n=1 Tax=Hyalomma asiaticum TaxID=266040 RepID=A0ACB7T855_HYAAI|nr:hypothetical protein HPB50_001692 [Hyalomma asiaticum]
MAWFEKYLPNVYWIFAVRRHKEVLEFFSGHVCQVITVSDREINVPSDGYTSCHLRRVYTAADYSRLLQRKPDIASYPKNARVTFAIDDSGPHFCFQSVGVFGDTIIQTFRVLNNTVVEECNHGETDSVLLSKRASLLLTRSKVAPLSSSYAYVISGPTPIGFLSRKSEPLRPSFSSTWMSFFAICLILVPMAATFLFLVHARARRHQERTSVLAWTTFFIATYMYRSTAAPTKSTSAVVRIIIGAWMLAIFFLVQFIQTDITASKSVPAYSPEIRHVTQLTARLDEGTVLPCIRYVIKNIAEDSKDLLPHMKSIHAANQKCFSGCLVSNISTECFPKARAGTHVLIHYLRAFLGDTNFPYGLVRGDDYFLTNIPIFPVHRRFPLRHQYRRLMLALEESGILQWQISAVAPQDFRSSSVPFDMPFTDYVFVYAVACSFSLLAFFVEILFASNPRAQFSPLALDVLEALTDLSTPAAVVGFKADAAFLGLYVKNTTKPVTFWSCTEKGQKGRCTAELTKYVAQDDAHFSRDGFVLVPSQYPPSAPLSRREMAWFEKYLPNVHWIFAVRRHEEVLEFFSGHVCQVITVSDSEINVPSDGYTSCHLRRVYTAADYSRLLQRKPEIGSYPKHARVTFANEDTKPHFCFKSVGHFGDIIIQAMRDLNNTVVEECNYGETDSLLLSRRASFIFIPSKAVPPHSCYAYVMAPPAPIGFLSRKGEPLRPSFASTWMSFFTISLVLVPVAATFLLLIHVSARQNQERTGVLAWTTFFIATYMCRSTTEPTKSTSAVVRITIVAWMFAIFFLGQFIQTDITASKSVPAFSPEIRHATELTSRLDEGTVLPCMHFIIEEIVEKSMAYLRHMKSIHAANRKCFSGCLASNISTECFSKARAGTHVLIHYLRPFFGDTNLPKGLVIGEDHLMTNLAWFPAHRRCPLR